MRFLDHGVKWQVATKKGKNFELLTVSAVARAFWYLWQKKKKPFGPLYTRCYRQFDTHRDFPRETINRFVSRAKKVERHRPGSILQGFIKHENILNALHEFDKKVERLNLSQLNNKQLIGVFRRSVFYHGRTVWYAYNPYFLQYLADDLYSIICNKVRDLNLQTQYFEVLTSSTKFSLMQHEQFDLLRIVRGIKRKKSRINSDAVQRLVDKHLRKYAFLGFYYLRGKPWTVGDVLGRVKEKLSASSRQIKLELAKLAQNRSRVNVWTALIKQLKFNKREIILVKTLKQMAYTMNLYEEVVNYHGFSCRRLFEEIARRLGIKGSEVVEMEVGEVIKFLGDDHPVDRAFKLKLRARMRESALVMVDGQIEVLEGQKLTQYRRQRKLSIKIRSNNLRGQPASAGSATGTAKLVRGLEDFGKVEKGDIMVAKNTIPSFLPAMERAAAIVAETGGLLSHAAIVSRELHIPCVVGVDNVMEILKDGNIVEVDAVSGVIKRL